MNQTEFDKKLHEIKTFIFDMDGVLTDGKVLIAPDNKMLRQMNIKDGYGIKCASMNGYEVMIITGSTSIESKERFLSLGVKEVHLDTVNKLQKFKEIARVRNLVPKKILYMGDDVADIQLMNAVGLGCCPKDASQDVREVADYISPLEGGKGCVRHIIEMVMRIQNTWKPTLYSQ